jgi:predicted transcriptional regulator
VLDALWRLKRASAPLIHAEVGEPRGLAYTTTAKVLDRLHEKALVERIKEGRSFMYRARVSQATVMRARAREAVALVFGSAPVPAIATLVDAVEAVDPALIEELERLVVMRRKARGGGRGRGS